jgi:tetratricopeptide (TPR) repeat protein
MTLLISHFSFLILSAQSDSLRQEAKRCYERGYYQQSIELLRNISEDSLSTDDMRLRYDCFCQTGQTDSLIYWGKRVVKRNPMADIIPDFTYRLNNADKEHVNPGLAIEICERYKQQDATHILVNRQLADAYYLVGNYDLALRELANLEALGDSCFKVLYTKGMIFMSTAQYGDAYEYLSRATARHNDTHGYCLFMLGIAANKIGLGAEALSYLDEAKKLMVPDRKTLFRLHQELAESFRMKGEPDFRLEELQECMRYAEEKDVNTLTYQMGKCYLQLRQFDKARETLGRFLDATKDKEYNNTIKSMRQSAEESLRMMMW